MHKESDFKHIEMPCKIVDFFDHNNPHGKVPVSMAEDLIIMEYKYHMKWWSENLDVDKWTSNHHLMEYMQTIGVQDQYVSMLMMTLP